MFTVGTGAGTTAGAGAGATGAGAGTGSTADTESTAVVNVVPAAGSPVPLTVPEMVGVPLTTDADRLLICPVKARPSRVPVTAAVVAVTK